MTSPQLTPGESQPLARGGPLGGQGGGHGEPRLVFVLLGAGPALPVDSLARSCRHRLSLLRPSLHTPMGEGLLGWESSHPHCLHGGSQHGAPQSSPQRGSLPQLGGDRAGTEGWHCGTWLVPVEWWVVLPWRSMGPSSRRVSVGFPLPGALCWTHFDPANLACGSCALPAFSRQKSPFSSFFLPAMTTAKYFYFRGSHVLPLHGLAVRAVPALPGWLCKARPPAATSRLGQSPAPGVLSPPSVGERLERCV